MKADTLIQPDMRAAPSVEEIVVPYLAAIGRILMIAIFVISGISKLGASDSVRAYMEAMNVPGFLFWPSVAFEIGSGMLIAIGYRTRFVAVLLAGYCLLTAAIFHTQLSDQMQQMMLMKNISMAGGFLLLACFGAGALSVDASRGK